MQSVTALYVMENVSLIEVARCPRLECGCASVDYRRTAAYFRGNIRVATEIYGSKVDEPFT
jgi:hypothetical protein